MKLISKGILQKNARRSILKWRNKLKRKIVIKARRLENKRKSSIGEILITPPQVFCFEKNYTQTVECLQSLKRLALVKSKNTRQSIAIDIKEIQEISISAALALAAEIDRWRKFVGKSLRPRNLNGWNARVRSLLRGLGFFQLLDVKDDGRLLQMSDEITVLPMISDTALDKKILASLSRISSVLHNNPDIYGALVEAAYNVTKHAYPHEHNWEYPPIIKGWWATACLDPKTGFVKFVIYDQGVGIPATLPRWQGWERVRQHISRIPLAGQVVNDNSELILAALEVDRSSLDGGHGKGLQDIMEILQSFNGASVMILSGKGSLHHTYGQDKRLRDNTLHIGGTLIEWTIPVRLNSEAENHGKHD
jgi:hypothetical protein